MKNIPAWLLFAILSVNTMGFYVYYVIALQRIYETIRAELEILPDDQLTCLTLSRAAYHASVVEDDEIRLNGKLYDVARLEFFGDSVKLFAAHDVNEENLMAFASEMICKPFEEDPSVTGPILQFISFDFLPSQLVNKSLNEGKDIMHQSMYSCLSNAMFLNIEAPPPRTVS
jgi:hypothetical protein